MLHSCSQLRATKEYASLNITQKTHLARIGNTKDHLTEFRSLSFATITNKITRNPLEVRLCNDSNSGLYMAHLNKHAYGTLCACHKADTDTECLQIQPEKIQDFHETF